MESKKKNLSYQEKLEKYGFAPKDAPDGTVERVVTDLLVPTGREEKYNKQLPKGFGVYLKAGIDGYKTDKFGRPIPKLGKEEVLARRRQRVCPAWPYCTENTPKCFFACQKHWYMLPPVTRTHIWLHSRTKPDMVKLKASVEECVTWLHYALGPSITPERLANRTLDLLRLAVDTEMMLLGGEVHAAVIAACEQGEAVSHAKHAKEVFEKTWQERLEYIWY